MKDKKHGPIIVFDIDDFIKDKNRFIQRIKPYFYNLPWDNYDLRKKQIDYLRNTSFYSMLKIVSEDIFKQYYLGEVDISALSELFQNLTLKETEEFMNIKPFRRRSAMRYILKPHGKHLEWCATREPVKTFSQYDAKIDSDNLDYRVYPRVFSETPEEIVDKEFFDIMKGIANMVVSVTKQAIENLDITIHHTYVEATTKMAGNNSPEGIHQDGYDYIVSALVVERSNIVGGVSQIFSEDKKNRLLVTKLQSGQGILQPDKGTNLWHNVTPFSVIPEANIGYRTSIGFDIALS